MYELLLRNGISSVLHTGKESHSTAVEIHHPYDFWFYACRMARYSSLQKGPSNLIIEECQSLSSLLFEQVVSFSSIFHQAYHIVSCSRLFLEKPFIHPPPEYKEPIRTKNSRFRQTTSSDWKM
jgi:hypothetical protein